MRDIVLHRALSMAVDPEALFIDGFANHEHAFWLDSSRVTEGISRFSFMGDASGPRSEVLSYNVETGLLTIHRGNAIEVIKTSVLDYAEAKLNETKLESERLPFDFCGGFIGYLGYELKKDCGARNIHSSPYPDAALIYVDQFVAVDHRDNVIWLVWVGPEVDADTASAWFDRQEAAISRLGPLSVPSMPKGEPPVFTMRHSKSEYLSAIGTCLDYINDGESYEICLTNTITSTATPDPFNVYRILRAINPAPYAAFLKLPELSVACSSPERFLKVDSKGEIESKPIKGTRARSSNAQEDLEIREELRSCEKDGAENLMIVDLLRNDLGRVSVAGSVRVPKLRDVETYETVHQLVSTIQSTLRSDCSVFDLLRASFPGGSMTGAPKHRTMEIIDRIESGPRGIYSGVLGFLSRNGTVDLNIVIRTIVLTPDGLSIGCGGAIIALSDPEDEYAEILQKAKAPMRAIALATCGDADRYVLHSERFLPPAMLSNATPFTVRQASPKDAEDAVFATLNLIHDLTGKTHTSSPERVKAAYLDILNNPASGAIFMARDIKTGALIGFASVSLVVALRTAGKYGLIQELWVDGAWRCQGIAGELLDACADYCLKGGATQLEVGLPRFGYKGLDKVEKIYHRKGFETIGPRMRLQLSVH